MHNQRRKQVHITCDFQALKAASIMGQDVICRLQRPSPNATQSKTFWPLGHIWQKVYICGWNSSTSGFAYKKKKNKNVLDSFHRRSNPRPTDKSLVSSIRNFVSMDTLSSSVSTFKFAAVHSTPRELCNLKAPPSTSQSHHQFHPHQSHLTSTRPNKSAASFTRRSFSNSYPSLTSSSGTSTPKSASPNSHRKAASGYAAALLDKALCHGSLEAVQKDVLKLSRLLDNGQIQAVCAVDPFVGDKGQIVKELLSGGKVNRYLAGLLRMLIERNKVAMVSEVLDEFQRIYDDLIGTRVVFVSSAKKMEEDQLFHIAKRVQNLCGAAQVKIRNLIHEGVLSYP